MNNFTAFIIKFTEPLHISDSKAEYTNSERIIHSDTVYAALMQVMSLVGEKPDISNFAISSFFPCFQINETEKKFEFFFPVLKLPKKSEKNEDLKNLKKIKYISKNLFEKQINNSFDSKDINPIKDFGISKDSYLFYDEKNKNIDENKTILFSSSIVPRVMVPRQKSDPEPFYFEKLFLNTKYWSLFLLATGNIEKLEKYLKILGEFGIGSDKTYGYGRFEIITNQISFKFNLPDVYEPVCRSYTNLSLYIPTDINSLDIKQSYFNIIKRGGYITTFPYTTYRKKSVFAFEEGSVITLNQQPHNFVDGKIVDLTPEIIQNEHKIFRSGKSILLPVKIK